MYLRHILDTATMLFQDQYEAISELESSLDDIENSTIEVFLSDGTKINMHDAIEDVIYGVHLHADKERIERLIKTNMTTYLFAAEKYVSLWDELLSRTYDLLNSLVPEKYCRTTFEKASVVFDGLDNTQGQDVRSAPYWSNLRGRDVSPEEMKVMTEQLSYEEMTILAIAMSFVEELQKDDYSQNKLKSMIYPVAKPYWGDFSKAHEELAGIELGISNKVRFNDTHDVAKVIMFKNFNSEGRVFVNQPQYSEDILGLFLKRDNGRSSWKVVSINVSPEDIIKTITIEPGKTVKKSRDISLYIDRILIQKTTMRWQRCSSISTL